MGGEPRGEAGGAPLARHTHTRLRKRTTLALARRPRRPPDEEGGKARGPQPHDARVSEREYAVARVALGATTGFSQRPCPSNDRSIGRPPLPGGRRDLAASCDCAMSSTYGLWPVDVNFTGLLQGCVGRASPWHQAGKPLSRGHARRPCRFGGAWLLQPSHWANRALFLQPHGHRSNGWGEEGTLVALARPASNCSEQLKQGGREADTRRTY